MFDKTKNCDRYTKAELVNLKKKYDIKLPKPNMTKKEICDFYKTLDWSKLQKENCLDRCDVPLRHYQKKVVDYINKNNRLLVYHKMGTGKTLTAVVSSQCYLDANPDKNVVVITPASLIDNFKKGILQYKNIKHKNNYKFYSIQKATNLLKKGELDCQNSMVIIDEVHNYRSEITFTKRTKQLKGGVNIFYGYKCFLKADKLLLLTGTVLYNKPDDLNLYKLLLNYDENQCKDMDLGKIINFYSKKDLDCLKCKISFHDFQKNDADFPKRIDIYKNVAMSPSYEDMYHKIMFELFQSVEDRPILQSIFQNLNPKNQNNFENLARRAIQCIENSIVNEKINTVLRQIERMRIANLKLQNKDKYKVVIYSQFKTHGIYLIKNKIEIPHAVISGDTKVQDRQKIVESYNQGKINVLFITKAGEEGLDLKGTDAVIIMEPSWNENTREQIIARAIRYKSHENRPNNRKVVRILNLIHTTKNDRSSKTKQHINKVMNKTYDKLPPMKVLGDIQSIDLLMSKYQQIKQRLLDNTDKKLKLLTIEKNKC